MNNDPKRDRMMALGTVVPISRIGNFESLTSVGLFSFKRDTEVIVNLRVMPGCRDDLARLSKSARQEFNDKVESSMVYRDGRLVERYLPSKRLRRRPGMECLDGARSMYLDNGEYRVIFVQSGNTVILIAAGERRNMAVYRRAVERIISK